MSETSNLRHTTQQVEGEVYAEWEMVQMDFMVVICNSFGQLICLCIFAVEEGLDQFRIMLLTEVGLAG